MSIFGYDSFSDMFDGGGPGQSNLDSSGNVVSYDNDNDPNNQVTGIAAISNTIAGNSAANNSNNNNEDSSGSTSTDTTSGSTSGSSDDTKSNSWTEWFANTFTPGDGAAYVNGV